MPTGPNGYEVRHDHEGNLVEMIPCDDEPDVLFPMILRRADPIIEAAYRVLWDKVWWNRHMAIHSMAGKDCKSEPLIGCDKAMAIEAKYGHDYLIPTSQVEWGITQGKMMALAWVHGSEWEGSGDT